MRPDRTARRIQKAIVEYLEIPRIQKRSRPPKTPKSEKLRRDAQKALARLGPTAADLATLSVFGGVPLLSPEELFLHNEKAALLMAAIETLPTDVSGTAKLLIFEREPIEEIAMKFGVTLLPDEAYELKKTILNAVENRVLELTQIQTWIN